MGDSANMIPANGCKKSIGKSNGSFKINFMLTRRKGRPALLEGGDEARIGGFPSLFLVEIYAFDIFG
jgi:hypothetical protein